ncbi:MAG: alpha/beta fold hydrolase [Oscillochloridaceae bacterium umkhey_bin13]
MSTVPAWLDRTLYPFTSHWLDLEGGRMHYIDEGVGEPIVFVHGTPTWSFLYRQIITAMAPTYRCLATDQLGFGLSDKPATGDYSFAAHTRNLTALVNHLGLERFTLVVHDLGGPIGLALALAQPERISRLVISNTTLWPMEGAFAPPAVAKLFATALGRFLYLQLNISPRTLLPMIYADRTKLTPAIHQHYLAPFPGAADRHALYAFAQQVATGFSALRDLWAQRERIVPIPTLLIWGMRDLAFGPPFLAHWREFLPQAEVVEVASSSHFVQEEAPEVFINALRVFMGAANRRAAVGPA